MVWKNSVSSYQIVVKSNEIW